MQQKTRDTALAIFTGAIIFLALEVAVYYGLVTWLIPTDPEVEAQGGTIVRNWGKVMAFVLGYVAVLVVVLLQASAQVPKQYKKHVLFWFYLALPTLLVILLVAFS